MRSLDTGSRTLWMIQIDFNWLNCFRGKGFWNSSYSTHDDRPKCKLWQKLTWPFGSDEL